MVGLFADSTPRSALRVLDRFDSQEREDRQSLGRFEAWLASVGYSRAVFHVRSQVRRRPDTVDIKEPDGRLITSDEGPDTGDIPMLTGFLDRIIASSELGLEHQIVALIREPLPTCGCSLAVIAPYKFVSVRTLQR